jgi:hypothetical protein
VVISLKELISGNTTGQVILNNMETKVITEEMLETIQGLVYDLGFDYERMSRSGKEIYDELCEVLSIDNDR